LQLVLLELSANLENWIAKKMFALSAWLLAAFPEKTVGKRETWLCHMTAFTVAAATSL
jgi:hypothetical protein